MMRNPDNGGNIVPDGVVGSTVEFELVDELLTKWRHGTTPSLWGWIVRYRSTVRAKEKSTVWRQTVRRINRVPDQSGRASSAPLLIPHNRTIRDCGGNVKIKIAGVDCWSDTFTCKRQQVTLHRYFYLYIFGTITHLCICGIRRGKRDCLHWDRLVANRLRCCREAALFNSLPTSILFLFLPCRSCL